MIALSREAEVFFRARVSHCAITRERKQAGLGKQPVKQNETIF
jgi:hypothetical protein